LNSSPGFHIEILPPAQKKLWPELAVALPAGFVLYGGTAIALHLGHRTSIDFDFFTDRGLDKKALENALPFAARSTVLQESVDTLTYLVPASTQENNPVKVSFFASLRFGRVGAPQRTADGVAQIASLEDLLGHKLKVILQRIEAKDYVDIAALLKAGIPLEHGLASARALFGLSFQPAESLKALVYFEGGDLLSLSPGLRKDLIEATRQVRALPDVKILSSSLAASL